MGTLMLKESCDLPKDPPAGRCQGLDHHLLLPYPGPDIFPLSQHSQQPLSPNMGGSRQLGKAILHLPPGELQKFSRALQEFSFCLNSAHPENPINGGAQGHFPEPPGL